MNEPSRPHALVSIAEGEELDALSLAMHHNEAERVIRSLQVRLATLESQHRELFDRLEALDGQSRLRQQEKLDKQLRERVRSRSKKRFWLRLVGGV